MIAKLESKNKRKLNKYLLINDDDIDESFQDDNISFETINNLAKKLKRDNQIIPSDDISYMSRSDIPYSEYENTFERTSRGWVGFSI